MASFPDFGASQGQGLAGPALGRQGIPQQGVVNTQPTTDEALSEIIAMIQGGQVGGERFMEFLSLLASSMMEQNEQQPAGPPAGPQQAPAGPEPYSPGLGGSPSIQDLLG